MDWRRKEYLEKKLGLCAFLFVMGIGVKVCIYKPIIVYTGLTDVNKEVFDFNVRKSADINGDDFLSQKERGIRDKYYSDCESTFFKLKYSYFLWGDLNEESDKILSCAKEKYRLYGNSLAEYEKFYIERTLGLYEEVESP